MDWVKQSLNRQVMVVMGLSMTLLALVIFASESYLVSESE